MTDDVPPGLDPAWAAWYDQIEDDEVQQAIELIRVYQFKMPDGIGPFRRGPWPSDWWSEFWGFLEREGVLEQRDVFVRSWIERNVPGGYQMDLEEVFSVDHERHDYILAGQTDLESFGARGGST